MLLITLVALGWVIKVSVETVFHWVDPLTNLVVACSEISEYWLIAFLTSNAFLDFHNAVPTALCALLDKLEVASLALLSIGVPEIGVSALETEIGSVVSLDIAIGFNGVEALVVRSVSDTSGVFTSSAVNESLSFTTVCAVIQFSFISHIALCALGPVPSVIGIAFLALSSEFSVTRVTGKAVCS